MSSSFQGRAFFPCNGKRTHQTVATTQHSSGGSRARAYCYIHNHAFRRNPAVDVAAKEAHAMRGRLARIVLMMLVFGLAACGGVATGNTSVSCSGSFKASTGL